MAGAAWHRRRARGHEVAGSPPVSARRLEPARRSFLAPPGRGRHLRDAADPDRRSRTSIMARGRGQQVGRGRSPACCFGATLLLALHTSHVRGRVIRVVARPRRACTVAWSAVLAAIDHEPFYGCGHVSIVLVIAAPAVILVPHLPPPGHQHRDDPRRDRRVPAARDLVRRALRDARRRRPALLRARARRSGVKYLYFSFVVITTLGFGDLTPRTDIGRVFVSLEALLGQIFLVTVVAVLVANMGRAVRRRGPSTVVDAAFDGSDEATGRRGPSPRTRSPGSDAELELGAPGGGDLHHVAGAGARGSSDRRRCRGRRGGSRA